MTKQEEALAKKQQQAQVEAAKKQLEDFRIKVQDNELIARFNKSEYEKMYYYLAAKKISTEFLEVARADEAEREQVSNDLYEQMKLQVDEQNENPVLEEVTGE